MVHYARSPPGLGLLIDEVLQARQDQWVVLKYPALFFFSLFLALGPGAVEQAHLRQANQFWAEHRAGALGQGKTPLRQVPSRGPVHDPSTCIVCMTLHAAIGSIGVHPVDVSVLLPGGTLLPKAVSASGVRLIIAENSRGPPVV
jgi:hypothetical protein